MAGAEIIDVTQLEFVAHPHIFGASYAKLPFTGCEAIIYRYPAGTHIPFHHHTDETLKVILQGRMKFDLGELDVGGVYKCDYSHGYGGDAISDTYMLLLQKPGTQSKTIPE